MALAKGDAGCTTGLSKRIYDNLVAGGNGFATTAAGITAGKAFAYAIACAIVDEVVANGQAIVSVASTGLQTSTAVGAPTGPPALETYLALK